MKNYIRPSMEVSKFDVADIITASGVGVAASTLTGDDLTIYEQYQVKAPTVSQSVQDTAVMFQW